MAPLLILWPTAATTHTVTRPYTPEMGNLEIAATAGDAVIAPVDGVAALVTRAGVTIKTATDDGDRLISISGLSEIAPAVGATLKRGDALGKAAGNLRIGITAAEDAARIARTEARLRPKSSLNLRKSASATADRIRTLATTETLESLEPLAATAAKLGVKDQWLNVRAGAQSGFAAAEFLDFDAQSAALYPIVTPMTAGKPFDGVYSEFTAAAGAPMVSPVNATVLAATGTALHLRTAGAAPSMITIDGLASITVQNGSIVRVGTPVGTAAGALRVNVGRLIDPTPMLLKGAVRVRPTQSLNFRKTPDMNGERIRALAMGEALESVEPQAATLAKIGVKDQWLNVKTSRGETGYAAAWLIEPIVVGTMSGNLTGMNLDVFHPLGKPDTAQLKGIGWVRLLYDVSFNPADGSRGNNNLDATHQLYVPYLQKLSQAGIKTLIVFTHQTWGEGQGYNWLAMSPQNWDDLIGKFAAQLKKIAQFYAGKNLVHAYQIWNEQDAPPGGAVASVRVEPREYGKMLTACIQAIRQVDPTTPIITGGHRSGPQPGSQYARQTFANMPSGVRPDGIAFHPYGRGPKPDAKSPHSFFGHIDEEIQAYGPLLPGKPVWMTEFGMLDADVVPADIVAGYATDFIRHLKTVRAGSTATAMWYAWAKGMHNGYGVVDENGRPREPLYTRFLTV